MGIVANYATHHVIMTYAAHTMLTWCCIIWPVNAFNISSFVDPVVDHCDSYTQAQVQRSAILNLFIVQFYWSNPKEINTAGCCNTNCKKWLNICVKKSHRNHGFLLNKIFIGLSTCNRRGFDEYFTEKNIAKVHKFVIAKQHRQRKNRFISKPKIKILKYCTLFFLF